MALATVPEAYPTPGIVAVSNAASIMAARRVVSTFRCRRAMAAWSLTVGTLIFSSRAISFSCICRAIMRSTCFWRSVKNSMPSGGSPSIPQSPDAGEQPRSWAKVSDAEMGCH